MIKNKSGFTIVELLVVIVTIAILTSIIIVVFNGVQERARDSARKSDIGLIMKALDMYYVDNGQYPQITATAPGLGGGAISSPPFANTWSQLESMLSPYIKSLPKDPINSNLEYRYTYESFGNNSQWPILCPASQPYQSYALQYRPESDEPSREVKGSCRNNQSPWLPAQSGLNLIIRVNP